MIDNLNINITDNNKFEQHLTNKPFIDLKNYINNCTGEIMEYPKKGEFYNMNIRINKVHSKIVGSLHILNNLIFKNEKQNFNDFTYNELSILLPYFIDKFDLENNNCLTKLELGFNIHLSYDPQKFIDNNLLMYNLNSHQQHLKFGGNGDYKEYIKNDYSLKIYNKSKQYKRNFNIKNNILRIELKLKTKRKIQSFGIYTLNDLLDKNKIFKLFQFLMNEFDKLTIIDTLGFEKLPQTEQEKLNKYTNPNYWQSLRNENKTYKVINRLKTDFKSLINKHSLNNIKNDIEIKLIENFWHLINHKEPKLFEPNK
ncbi:hypothetical protein [Flavobacterium oreochromis]|uniref:hypothetical protein n=1 Tax=Flavobacterium oreochromis TaxID=2906078 RepID=UPI00385C8364